MVLGTLVRYGIPFSFVYCTLYQQDIWREGDDKLILEQKRVWKDFFNMIDDGYSAVASKLLISQNAASTRLNMVEKMESMNVKQCWNAKVSQAFSAVDKLSTTNALNIDQWTKFLGLSKS